MSEQEFDLYLSLMSRFLKLTPQQRDEVAEELRDHLELRMEELTGEGHTRQEAIHLALEEMGDAGELAQHFSQIAISRRRRFMMRCTAGTIVSVAAAYFLVTAFWPHAPGQPGLDEAIAQDEAKQQSVLQEAPSELLPMAAKTKVYKEEYLEEWDEILDAKNELTLDGLTIEDMLSELSLEYNILILVDEVVFDITDAMTSETLEKNYKEITLKNMLRYILEPHDLAFVPCRDRMLRITTEEELMANSDYLHLRIYDCRDFLAHSEKEGFANLHVLPQTGTGGGFGGGGGGAFFNVQLGGGATRLGGAGSTEKTKSHNPKTGIEILISIIQDNKGTWREKDGEGGTIKAYNGLLLVYQTSKGHEQTESFLNLLRKPYLDQSLARSDAEQGRD